MASRAHKTNLSGIGLVVLAAGAMLLSGCGPTDGQASAPAGAGAPTSVNDIFVAIVGYTQQEINGATLDARGADVAACMGAAGHQAAPNELMSASMVGWDPLSVGEAARQARESFEAYLMARDEPVDQARLDRLARCNDESHVRVVDPLLDFVAYLTSERSPAFFPDLQVADDAFAKCASGIDADATDPHALAGWFQQRASSITGDYDGSDRSAEAVIAGLHDLEVEERATAAALAPCIEAWEEQYASESTRAEEEFVSAHTDDLTNAILVVANAMADVEPFLPH